MGRNIYVHVEHKTDIVATLIVYILAVTYRQVVTTGSSYNIVLGDGVDERQTAKAKGIEHLGRVRGADRHFKRVPRSNLIGTI